MRRAKGNPCACRRGGRVGADMHSSLSLSGFFLCSFSLYIFFFLSFLVFKAAPGLPAMVNVIKNRVMPVPPRSGGSEEQETEGGREGESQ